MINLTANPNFFHFGGKLGTRVGDFGDSGDLGDKGLSPSSPWSPMSPLSRIALLFMIALKFTSPIKVSKTLGKCHVKYHITASDASGKLARTAKISDVNQETTPESMP